MSRSCKTLGETSGKNRLCLRCFHCRFRVFRDLDELEEWCKKKEIVRFLTWKKRFKKEQQIRLYWCIKLPDVKPRIFNNIGKPFRLNCKMFDGDPINDAN